MPGSVPGPAPPWHGVSQDEWHQRAPLFRVVLELGVVPRVVLDSPGADVARRGEGKGRGSEGPASNGKARPFHALAKEVGAGHQLEHAAARDLVPGLPGLAQVEEYVVRVYVDRHAHRKARQAASEPRVPEPVLAVDEVLRERAALKVAVHEAEDEGHQEDHGRGGLAPADPHGEHEGAVEVVQQERPQECDIGRGRGGGGRAVVHVEGERDDEGGQLLEHPRHFAVDGWAPPRGGVAPVRGLDAGQEQHGTQHHAPQQARGEHVV
eukprot:CAMPEP_0206009320 /NCGR_PEP_ID=MMETSP1464-20131121/9481_1 /ASSEMBLY_ACC=CAM_ASM_001124 /TAXON_ID=119497 /ORGANISM="Exanthemachrysis gayraliae, Strain RCC1523" /LENGTH=265 /DNA_ID=CAMNT_0053382917 /DNA_START=71 /DNA_END=864 /DNA_ORIENTATION=-